MMYFGVCTARGLPSCFPISGQIWGGNVEKGSVPTPGDAKCPLRLSPGPRQQDASAACLQGQTAHGWAGAGVGGGPGMPCVLCISPGVHSPPSPWENLPQSSPHAPANVRWLPSAHHAGLFCPAAFLPPHLSELHNQVGRLDLGKNMGNTSVSPKTIPPEL